MKIANKIGVAIAVVIVVQVLNTVIISSRSNGLQNMADKVIAPPAKTSLAS